MLRSGKKGKTYLEHQYMDDVNKEMMWKGRLKNYVFHLHQKES